jgi:hypothetical protein
MAVIDAKLLAANESIGPARLQTVERIFHEALERGSGPLAAFLRRRAQATSRCAVKWKRF